MQNYKEFSSKKEDNNCNQNRKHLKPEDMTFMMVRTSGHINDQNRERLKPEDMTYMIVKSSDHNNAKKPVYMSCITNKLQVFDGYNYQNHFTDHNQNRPTSNTTKEPYKYQYHNYIENTKYNDLLNKMKNKLK
jgi:hypothetical protein